MIGSAKDGKLPLPLLEMETQFSSLACQAEVTKLFLITGRGYPAFILYNVWSRLPGVHLTQCLVKVTQRSSYAMSGQGYPAFILHNGWSRPLPLKRLDATTKEWAGAVGCPWNCTAPCPCPCQPQRLFNGQFSGHRSCRASRVPLLWLLSPQGHVNLQSVSWFTLPFSVNLPESR